MKIKMVAFTLFMLLIFPLCASAGKPLDTVQNHVNDVLQVLRDPAMKGDAAEPQKKEKLRIIANNMFEFTILSKRSLGKDWKKLSSDQQKEFVSLYKKILEKAYMDKIITYTDEKVEFTNETMLSEKKAEVRSMIITASQEIPVNYRVVLTKEKWMVYDVIIENISLVKNYRSQFRSILSNKSPEELMKILREKAAKV